MSNPTVVIITDDNSIPINVGITTELPIIVTHDLSNNVPITVTTSSQGPPGIKGEKGIQGLQGVQGITGAGVDGVQGLQGIIGAQGTVGLQGVQGTVGLQGLQGVEGKQGVTGSQGLQGIHGTLGLQGIQGIEGSQGIQGAQGTLGLQGIQGIEGSQGVQGTLGLQGIQGSAGVATVDVNKGLTLTGDSLGTIYNTLIDDSVNSVAVGGAAIASASVWKTKNMVQVLDTILFPDVAPTYTIPTISTSSTITGTREIGESISPVITTVGNKNDAGAFTSILTRRNSTTINTNITPVQNSITNIATQFGYADPNNPNYSYSSTYTDEGFIVVSGSTTWNALADYNNGLPKKNNKGINDVRAFSVRSVNAPQSASTGFGSSNSTVTGIYPYFWGVSGISLTASDVATIIASGSANKILSTSVGTISITFAASSQYVWVAIPIASTVKTTWYNTGLNNGSIGAGQFILAPISQNVNSPNNFWTAVTFRIYISGYASSTSGSIEFRN